MRRTSVIRVPYSLITELSRVDRKRERERYTERGRVSTPFQFPPSLSLSLFLGRFIRGRKKEIDNKVDSPL